MKYIQATVAGAGQIFSLWHYEPEPEISSSSSSSDSALEVPSYSEVSACVSCELKLSAGYLSKKSKPAREISFADSHQVVQMYLHSCAVSTYCLKLENASNQADLTFYEYRYTGHWVWCPRQLGLDLHDRLCMDARETTRVASMRIQNPWRDKR